MKKQLLFLFIIILPLCTTFGLPMPNGDDLFVTRVQTDENGNVVSVLLDAPQNVTTPIGIINACMNLTFHPNGMVKEVEPSDRNASVKIETSQGEFLVKGPYQFHENGTIAQGWLFEPTTVDLSIGTMQIFYMIGFHPNKVIKSVSLYGEQPRASGLGAAFDAATPNGDFLITTKNGTQLSVQEKIFFYDDGNLQRVRLSRWTPFIFNGNRFLGYEVTFYQSGNIQEINIENRLTLLMEGTYIEIVGPLAFFENGNIASFRSNQRIPITTSLGVISTSGRFWFYESGMTEKMEIPTGTKINLFDTTVEDSLSFYENGRPKEIIFYRSHRENLPFAIKRLVFYPNSKIKVLEYAGNGEYINDEYIGRLRVDRGDLLYFDGNAHILGKCQWDEEKGDYVLIE